LSFKILEAIEEHRDSSSAMLPGSACVSLPCHAVISEMDRNAVRVEQAVRAGIEKRVSIIC
jgi:hypothetical protein